MVQAKLENGGISDPATFAFSIRTPWFISTPAIIIYLLSFTGLILSLILVPNQKLKKEKEKLLTEKEASDAKVELIQEEKLKAEIDFKTTELATSTMHLVQKNETISKIKSEIEKVRKNIKDPTAKKEMKRVISLLSDDERLENEWENFSTYFDQVHTDFLKRISKGYPQLTSKDKKLCAYLRLNLSTKEIAPLMNISVRGVEISRYRLRKKMELEKSVNLNDYMMNY